MLASVPTASEESLHAAGNDAFNAGDYRSAASHWETLARRKQLKSHRGAVVFATANAWKMDYDAHHQASSLCAGIGLIQWYFGRAGQVEPEIVQRYWSLVELKSRDGVACKLRATGTQQVVDPRLVESSKPSPTTDRDKPAKPAEPFTVTGALLTSVGLVGAAGMTGLLVSYAKKNRELKEIGVRGPEAESVYYQGKLLENWAVASGVVGGISLVTGVALLAVGRHRKKLTVTPQLGGLTLQGRF